MFAITIVAGSYQHVNRLKLVLFKSNSIRAVNMLWKRCYQKFSYKIKKFLG
jgi:hypothetical protein